MLTRREVLLAAGASALLALDARLAFAQSAGGVITKPVPSTGEKLPIIGLGSSATFSQVAGRADVDAIAGVIAAMLGQGGTVFDTAPSYGASEEVAAKAVNEHGMRDKVFWATKLNVAGFGGGSADPKRAREQVETSFRRLGREKIDLIQVHNVGDPATQLPILAEYKRAGRLRYLGVTSTFKPQYAKLEQLMRSEKLDFIGVDYAVDNLDAEKTILPLAQERGIAVLGYMPFGRTRLWDRVKGHAVPEWAKEFGAATWAQFFLKFAASHAAVTVVTPATSSADHMLDNMTAIRGRLPDQAERRRMVQFIEALPA
ncbi:MAG TPA: aldo/keto reductase [Gammaproteobacteria bacterium]|jgi:aryl-alcohol dehydrogenase-like predicted oxidoreductase|nr:aldo/keto reductase [Gammaproteobacteria bacterium]